MDSRVGVRGPVPNKSLTRFRKEGDGGRGRGKKKEKGRAKGNEGHFQGISHQKQCFGEANLQKNNTNAFYYETLSFSIRRVAMRKPLH